VGGAVCKMRRPCGLRQRFTVPWPLEERGCPTSPDNNTAQREAEPRPSPFSAGFQVGSADARKTLGRTETRPKGSSVNVRSLVLVDATSAPAPEWQ